MLLETFSYTRESGWSSTPFPELDSDRTLVLVFGAAEYLDHSDPIRELATAYPNSHLLGCSTAGEIRGTGLADASLAVAVMQLQQGTLATAFAPIQSADDSYEAGVAIGRQLDRPDLRGVLLLSDGLNINGTPLVHGVADNIPAGAALTGGLAGDGDRFQRTWVLKDGQPTAGFVSAVGFYGECVSLSYGSRGGWDIFGPERRVTRSRNNVLYELDNRPALELYKEYLGDLATGLPATALLFPLALRSNTEDGRSLVRTILAVNEAEQSMSFAGDIPEGALAQLMRANFDRLIDGASEAAQVTGFSQPDGGTMLAVAISCVGRRLVLGARTEEEIEATLEALPAGTQQIGFYSYGEISPYTTGGCDLHNQTMTLTLIREV
jgi:hypothetical protein